MPDLSLALVGFLIDIIACLCAFSVDFERRLVVSVVETCVVASVIVICNVAVGVFGDVSVPQMACGLLSEVTLHHGNMGKCPLPPLCIRFLSCLGQGIHPCKANVFKMGKVGYVEVTGLSMESDLRFWIAVEVDAIVPEKLLRAEFFNSFEDCVSEFAFHWSHVVLDIVVPWCDSLVSVKVIQCAPTEVRYGLEL